MKIPRWSDWEAIDSLSDEPIPEEAQYCSSVDVARLEASHAELLEAAKDMLAWWDHRRPNESAQDYINRLRAAIAKAERSEDEPITDDEGEL